jgi:UDP-N-acetylglucosamine--N-acetylmuramyl-(pentapeptide) pyrophosphoryl-undecaprenol N-acetylglucosamine transferase
VTVAACFAVVAGGGTAGHVLPALAVADALVAAGHDAGSIHYVGSQRGIETRLLTDTAYPHTFLDVVGFQRRIDRRNFTFGPKMVVATRTMVRALRVTRPEVVVSVGGYASMPAVFAAQVLRIPVVVVSYDRTPGRASRLAARRGAASAVAFPGSPLPRAVVTGAPVRQAILDVDRVGGRAAARRELGISDDRFLMVVMGGSLGSGVLNDAVAAYVRAHVDDRALAVHQIAGERFAPGIESLDRGDDGVLHRVVGYEPDMPSLYTAADLLIGRGGASTVHEVAVTGVPAILVPWSGATDDHQRHNVAWLTDVNAAVMLTDDQVGDAAGPGYLGTRVDWLRADPLARQLLSEAAYDRGSVHRSGALASLIDRVAITSRPS